MTSIDSQVTVTSNILDSSQYTTSISENVTEGIYDTNLLNEHQKSEIDSPLAISASEEKEEEKERKKSKRGIHDLQYLNPLPLIESDKLKRQFILDHHQIEVTSIDITSHGCYILAGCSNGMILLYDMTSSNQTGHVIGHIFAKGLHTSLLLVVKITDDCRFCFAGVHKGSSELLAIDLGELPVFRLPTIKSNTKSPSTAFPYDLIKTFKHSDAKLRGFSTAVRVGLPTDPSSTKDLNTYRLACGKGIKNIHVWQFEPAMDGKDPIWTCMCDVASNGMTIENLVFRLAGRELVSKSSDANLRVWDLRSYDSENGLIKPPYEDISNSQDVKAILDNYAFGGTYNFAVVKITAPKAANRDSFEMPERSIEDENGNRRKRLLRQIQEVVGTSDGRHVLVLCADGIIMYFCRNDDDSSEMIEFNTLQRDPELDNVWGVFRVGSQGQAILIRAKKSIDRKSTCILVDTLENVASEVKSSVLSNGMVWNPWGYYSISNQTIVGKGKELSKRPTSDSILENKDPNIESKNTNTITTTSTSTSTSITTIHDRKNVMTPKYSVKRIVANAKAMNDSSVSKTSSDSLAKILEPSPRTAFTSLKSSQTKSNPSSISKSKSVSYQTPDVSNLRIGSIHRSSSLSSSSSSLAKSSPEDDISRLVYASNTSPKRASSRISNHERIFELNNRRTRDRSVNFTGVDSTGEEVNARGSTSKSYPTSMDDEENIISPIKKSKIVRPVSIIPRLVLSTAVIPMITPPKEIVGMNLVFNHMKRSWMSSMSSIVPCDAIQSQNGQNDFGQMTLAQIDVIHQDHDRIRSQFSSEVIVIVSKQYQQIITTLTEYLSRQVNGIVVTAMDEYLSNIIYLSPLITKTRQDVQEMIMKEQMDLNISYGMDMFEKSISSGLQRPPKIVFRYEEMFDLSFRLESQLRELVKSKIQMVNNTVPSK